MGWEEVWRLAMKHFVAEPIELRIAIGLALAFFTLMILVGLRHAFRPAGPRPEPRLPEIPRPLVLAAVPAAPLTAVLPAPVLVSPGMAVPSPYRSALQLSRANKAVPRNARKSVKQTIKPYAPPRPKIRRAPEGPRA